MIVTTLQVPCKLDVTRRYLSKYTDGWIEPRLQPTTDIHSPLPVAPLGQRWQPIENYPSNPIGYDYAVVVGTVWCRSNGEVIRDDRKSLGCIMLTAPTGDRTEVVIKRGDWGFLDGWDRTASENAAEVYQRFFDQLIDVLLDLGATGERVIDPGTGFEERVEIGRLPEPTPAQDGEGGAGNAGGVTDWRRRRMDLTKRVVLDEFTRNPDLNKQQAGDLVTEKGKAEIRAEIEKEHPNWADVAIKKTVLEQFLDLYGTTDISERDIKNDWDKLRSLGEVRLWTQEKTSRCG